MCVSSFYCDVMASALLCCRHKHLDACILKYSDWSAEEPTRSGEKFGSTIVEEEIDVVVDTADSIESLLWATH